MEEDLRDEHPLVPADEHAAQGRRQLSRTLPPVRGGGGGVVPGGAVVLLAVVVTSCATALNYLEPLTPSYECRFGEPEAPVPAAVAGAPFRVVSFNIAYARQVDRALELLREAPLLAADVLLLQEMDAPSVERIARGLGLNSVYMPSGVHPKSGRDFGCAILSPWPLREPRKLVLPHAARVSRLRRAVVVATLRRGDRRVRIYGVHLSSPLGISGGSRRDQVKALLADAAGSPDPVVVAGDFNSHGIGEAFVEAGFTWVTRDVGTTTRFLLLGLSYDHVFARGLVPVRSGPAFGVVADNRGASDHRPVWALLVPEGEAAGSPEASSAATRSLLRTPSRPPSLGHRLGRARLGAPLAALLGHRPWSTSTTESGPSRSSSSTTGRPWAGRPPT